MKRQKRGTYMEDESEGQVPESEEDLRDDWEHDLSLHGCDDDTCNGTLLCNCHECCRMFDDDDDAECTWCGGDCWEECDDWECTREHTKTGEHRCRSCGGSGLRKDMTIW